MTERLNETDHLRLQLATAKAEKARAEAQVAALLFDQEVTRIAAALGLTSADSIDVPSGVVTRAPKPEVKP